MSAVAPVIVIAPDSLKGSCSSAEATIALAQGVRSVFGDAAEIREVPMADGGEGTLETLIAAWGGTIEVVHTTDALGRPREGRVGYGRYGNLTKSSIIEAADANGLPAVADQILRPLDADSAGVGILVRAALDADVDEILLCIGGSATSDGGAGMLRMLGVRLLDDMGQEVEPGVRGLAQLHETDLSGLDPRSKNVRWRIACDVDNPLLGPRGAAAVFGPQKGASAADVEAIDTGLERLLTLVAEASGTPAEALRALEGLGAAGGIALGLVSIFGAELVPGAELVSQAVGLRDALQGATFAITGEGRLDTQSLDGKVVSQVLADAEAHTSVFVIAGSVDLTAEQCRDAGIAAALSIATGPAPLTLLQAESERLLAETAAQLCGAILAAQNSAHRLS